MTEVSSATKKTTPEEFIRQYKAAVKVKLSREQFSKLLGILPDSLRRRRLSIEKQFGLSLPFLSSTGESHIQQDQLERYYDVLQQLELKEEGKVETDNISGFRRYVITSAQNNTPVHEPFLKAINTYCEHNDAKLIVIPYRYKNPTSIWNNNNKNDEFWAAPLIPHLLDKMTRLSDNLVLMANVKIQPTATQPLSGFEGYTGSDSAIIGHPKIQLKTVPTMGNDIPKLLVSTGAITIPNYTDSKAGWKGAFHHSLAAIVVELDDDDIFHIRHIHCDQMTGEFYDLDKLYTATEVIPDQRVEALVAGDVHAEFIDPDVEHATYTGRNSIANILKPKYFIFHDLTDFYARNHHHRGNDIIGVGKHRYGRNNVEAGLQQAADFIDRVSRDGTTNIVVKSNHDEAFDRWLREADIRGDWENAQFYYYMKYHQMKSINMNDTGFASMDPFEFWCKHPDQASGLKSLDKTKFLKRDESFNLCGVELGFHGDVGPNGARGNITAFSKMSMKMIIGHSHTPGIYESVVQVGVSSRLNLEYKRGPSSWLCSHAILYPNGKRTLINVINGKWRLEEDK